jgi:thiamine biosynthesis lipoprotein
MSPSCATGTASPERAPVFAPAARCAAVAGLVVSLAVAAGSACRPRSVQKLEGRTMGTTYHVTLVGVTEARAAALQPQIDRRLEEVNDTFSTYRPQSELSRFNQLARAGEPFPVSADFQRVMAAAARVHELSDGAWDGTVLPLVELWGFGPGGPVREPPADEAVRGRMADVGFRLIETRGASLVKRRASVTLDLASIAKGYGVDAVADVVRRAGVRDFIVEIGGEVIASGTRKDGRPWRVGINRPSPDAAPDELFAVVHLRDQAFATSGDYRNFLVEDGVRYSHVLDPRTGRPVRNGVVSVSVLAPDCTLADGLATAVMVMGAEVGIALLDRLDGVEGLVLVEAAGGRLEQRRSRGFRAEPVSGRETPGTASPP